MEDDLRSAASAAPPSYRAEEIRTSLLADVERLGPDRDPALVTAAVLIAAVALLVGLGGLLAGAIVEPPPAPSVTPSLWPSFVSSPPRESVGPSSTTSPATPDSVLESLQPAPTVGDQPGQPSPSPAPAGSVPPVVTPGPEPPPPPSPAGPPDPMPSIPATGLPSFVP